MESRFGDTADRNFVVRPAGGLERTQNLRIRDTGELEDGRLVTVDDGLPRPVGSQDDIVFAGIAIGLPKPPVCKAERFVGIPQKGAFGHFV